VPLPTAASFTPPKARASSPAAKEPLQERAHAEGRGEHRAARKRGQRKVQRHGPDRGPADDLRAERAQLLREPAGARAGRRHEQLFPEERRGRKPVELTGQRAHPPHDDERRGDDLLPLDHAADLLQRRDELALVGPRAVFDDGAVHVPRHPGREQARGDLAAGGDRHEEDQRAVQAHKRLKIQPQRPVFAPVARDEVHGGAEIAVRHGDARVGRGRDGRRHARHHLEGDAARGGDLQLLAAPAEEEAVAALEPHDRLALEGLFDEDLVDPVLRDGVAAGIFADVDLLRPRGHHGEDVLPDQPVVDHDVGAPQRLLALPGEKSRVAGARADQNDFSRLHLHSSRIRAASRAPSRSASRRGPESRSRRASPPGPT
jgi:hypothetical protein